MGKIVAKWLVLAFFCVLTASCASKRLTTRETEESVSHAKTERMSEFDLFERMIRNGISTNVDSLIQNQKIHFVVYDTDKTDPNGSHPIKMEGDIETNTKQGSRTETNDSLTIEKDVIRKDSLNTSQNDSLAQKKDVNKERSSTKATDFLSFAFMLLIIFVFYVTIKIYKRYKR